MTRDQKETVALNANMNLVASILSIVIASITMPLITILTKDGNIAGAYTKVAILFALLSAVTLIVVYLTVKERTFAEDEHIKSVKVLPLVKSVITNKYFIVLSAASLTTGLCSGIAMSTMPYYASYNLGNGNYVSIFTICLYGGSILAALLVARLSAKFDLRKIFIAGALLMFAAFAIRLIDHDAHMSLMIMLSALGYFGYGFIALCLVPMLIDTASYGQYKTGIAASGVYLSAFPLLMKIGGGLGGSILGFWMDSAGYDQTLPQQNQAVLDCFFYGTVLVDAIGAFIAAVLIFLFYKLSKAKMIEIHQALAKNSEKNTTNW